MSTRTPTRLGWINYALLSCCRRSRCGEGAGAEMRLLRYRMVLDAGQGRGGAGSPTPHTFSSTPTPQSPPPRAVRAEARNLSPARLAGEHVGPSSIGAIARAMPMRTTRDAHRYNNNNNITNSAEETRSERLKSSPQICFHRQTGPACYF